MFIDPLYDAGQLLRRTCGEMDRRSLPSFIAKSFATVNPGTEFLPNWHINLVAEYLEACRKSEITRLIINMPPRMLKSLCVSVAWPAFLLGRDPSARILAASYAASLAIKHSLDCRMIVQAPWYRKLFPGVTLSGEQNEKHKFLTTQRGFRMASSVGGSVTGEGGNYLIVDDPLNPLQASREASRSLANRWFDHTFATRLDDKRKGVIVVVMQRLHEEDLSGYLLGKGGWENLCLPAIAPEARYIDFGRVRHWREEGSALHPGRENLELLERARRELGSHAFAAQYQQMPVPPEGQMLRPHWLKRYAALPDGATQIVQSWDTAIKAGTGHDASACLTFAEGEAGYYLLDAQVLRLEYPELKKAVMVSAEQWQPGAILIEDKASGQSLLQDLRRETRLPVIPVRANADKVTRFASASALIEAGRLHLPVSARWLAEFESELFAFPHGGHDDQVDALSQFLNWTRGRSKVAMGIRRL